MSINQLTLDRFKPWLNVRVHDLCVDGTFKGNLPAPGPVSLSDIESEGLPARFLYDNGTNIVKKDILLPDLQNIGISAPDGSFLRHNAGSVSFESVPAGGDNIYTADGQLLGNRTIDGNSNNLLIEDTNIFAVHPSPSPNADGSTLIADTSHVGFIRKNSDDNYYCYGDTEASLGHVNSVNLRDSRVVCNGSDITLISNDAAKESKIIVDSVNESITIDAKDKFLSGVIDVDNTEEKLLCVDNSGLIKQRLVGSLPVSIPDDSVTPAMLEEGLDGQYLKTDGVSVVWSDPDPLVIPDDFITPAMLEEGADGQYLKTDGVSVVWSDPDPLVIPDDSISTAKLQDSSVSAIKLQDSSVSTIKLQDSSVSTIKLQDDSVSTIKLQDDSVSTIKLQDLSISNAKLKASSVSTLNLQNSSVTNAKILPSINDGEVLTTILGATQWAAIPSFTIPDDSITNAKMADDSIGNAELIDDSISTVKLQDSSVSNAKLQDDSVSTIKLQDDSVTEAKILPGSNGEFLGTIGGITQWAAVPASTPANDSITPDMIQHGSNGTVLQTVGPGGDVVWAPYVNTVNSIATSMIQNLAVDTSKIAVGAIVHSKLNPNIVHEENILDGSITTSKILDGSIGNSKVSIGSLNADRLVAGSNGQVLMTLSSTPQWVTQTPTVVFTKDETFLRAVNANASNNTRIAFAIVLDQNDMSLTNGGQVMTGFDDGWYRFTFTCSCNNVSNGESITMRLRKNTSTESEVTRSNTFLLAGSSDNQAILTNMLQVTSSGDVFDIFVTGLSGTVSLTEMKMSIVRVI